MATFFIIEFAIVLYIGYRLYRHFFPTPNIDPNGKYVLISGCDSGFGHSLAVELDKLGFNVLAGVYLADSINRLKNELSPKATVFRLDITNNDDIDGAFELIKNKTKFLHGLVNNAGIGASGNIDWTSMETMRKVMDVNYFGHVAMTKKFLPLLISTRDSRVVNICSATGYLTLPGVSAYCASKYALESFSDGLRREMYHWGLRVSIIEPGFMRTPLLQEGIPPFPDFWNSLSTDVQERWGEEFFKERHREMEKNDVMKYAEDPIKVVRAVQHAIMNTAPHTRYRPGIQSSLIFFPISMLPAGIADYLLRKLIKSTHIPASVQKQLQD